jgi:hypothetical protein
MRTGGEGEGGSNHRSRERKGAEYIHFHPQRLEQRPDRTLLARPMNLNTPRAARAGYVIILLNQRELIPNRLIPR